ncbi:MAG: hypothetical protein LBP85_00390, partial [Prevotellaceae bacterium]|nr:hypothetical protein [Prevotellaceae bacterium]
MKTMTLFRALGAGNDSSETSKKITKLLSIIPEKTSESNVPNTSSDRQTVTYDVPTLLISTSGEQYEAQPGYYFVGILDKDGRIVQGTLFDSGK